MRIAVNARILQAPRTGIGHYLVELLGALQAHADFEFSLFHGWGWSGDLPAAALPGYSRLSPWLRNLPGAYRARRWLEQRRFDSGRPPVDLYHEPSLWPLDFDGPMLMTLHDLTHLHYPATQPAARLREIERRLARGMEKARLILTDSQARSPTRRRRISACRASASWWRPSAMPRGSVRGTGSPCASPCARMAWCRAGISSA